jgi:hypothetical protein
MNMSFLFCLVVLVVIILNVIIINSIRKYYKFKMLLDFYVPRHTKSQSIYVAGAWIHREKIHEEIIQLQKLGFNITSTWTNRQGRWDTPDDYKVCSELDMLSIMKADTILAFMTDPNYDYRGTFTEIGCGIGSGRRVIIICDGKFTKEDIYHQEHSATGDNTTLTTQTLKSFKFSHYCMKHIFFWDKIVEHASTIEEAVKMLNGEKVKTIYDTFYTGQLSEKVTSEIKKCN